MNHDNAEADLFYRVKFTPSSTLTECKSAIWPGKIGQKSISSESRSSPVAAAVAQAVAPAVAQAVAQAVAAAVGPDEIEKQRRDDFGFSSWPSSWNHRIWNHLMISVHPSQPSLVVRFTTSFFHDEQVEKALRSEDGLVYRFLPKFSSILNVCS